MVGHSLSYSIFLLLIGAGNIRGSGGYSQEMSKAPVNRILYSHDIIYSWGNSPRRSFTVLNNGNGSKGNNRSKHSKLKREVDVTRRAAFHSKGRMCAPQKRSEHPAFRERHHREHAHAKNTRG